MSDLKENGMSNGEVLAAVNKKFITKIQKPQKLPVQINPLMLLIKFLRLSIEHGTGWTIRT
jgi:hypothetical protein